MDAAAGSSIVPPVLVPVLAPSVITLDAATSLDMIALDVGMFTNS